MFIYLPVWLSAQYNDKCSTVRFHNYSDMSQFRPRPRGTSIITIIISLDSGYRVSWKSEFFEIWLWRTYRSALWVLSRATPRVRGSSTFGDSIVLDALLNVAHSWCVLASRRNVRLNSWSPLGTNRFVIRLRCSEKLSADLHLLSACKFVAQRTQQSGVVWQPIFPNQFSAICEIGRIRRKCPFPDRFHRPPQAAQQQY